MSFGTELHTLLSSDASLNSYCDDGIYYELYPTNIGTKKTGMVYTFNKTGAVTCMSGGLGATNYSITITIKTPNALLLETINDYLVKLLHGYTSKGIQLIEFQNDDHFMSLEEETFSNVLNFNAIY